jgi:3'(2'), 5'-bisphosphate nucleotidase
MNRELDAARELAVRAGDILLEHYAGSPSIHWKGVNDPVTAADREASAFLVREIRKRFPGDGILSEEEPDDTSRLDRDRVWIIDPMDGTKEFIARRGEFAVMIGLAVVGKPVMGVVYQPTARRLYYGASAAGAFVDTVEGTQPLRVSAEVDPSRLILTVSRSHLSRRTEKVRRELGIHEVIRSGGIGIKVGLICERRADLYLHLSRGTSLWDTCAPEAILIEAGGRLTDAANAPLRYNVAEHQNQRGVVASNGVIHDRVIEIIGK